MPRAKKLVDVGEDNQYQFYVQKEQEFRELQIEVFKEMKDPRYWEKQRKMVEWLRLELIRNKPDIFKHLIKPEDRFKGRI